VLKPNPLKRNQVKRDLPVYNETRVNIAEGIKKYAREWWHSQ
jgi:D-alanyl-D-alanine dipeptidase